MFKLDQESETSVILIWYLDLEIMIAAYQPSLPPSLYLPVIAD